MNKKMKLDVYIEDSDLNKFKQEVEKKYGLKVTVLCEIGPGSGNPYVMFEGPVENLKEWWIHDYCGEATLEAALESVGFENFDELLD